MKIFNEAGNLQFDVTHPDCQLLIKETQGELYAFIVCLFIGSKSNPLEKPKRRYYWGKFSWMNEAGSLRDILNTGATWPELPEMKS